MKEEKLAGCCRLVDSENEWKCLYQATPTNIKFYFFSQTIGILDKKVQFVKLFGEP